MRKYNRCTKCHEWHWDDSPCEPQFNVYYEDYSGDEPNILHAHDHEDAALKFAENYNTISDYRLMNDEIIVKVERLGVVKYFYVGAKPSVHYSATEIESSTIKNRQ